MVWFHNLYQFTGAVPPGRLCTHAPLHGTYSLRKRTIRRFPFGVIASHPQPLWQHRCKSCRFRPVFEEGDATTLTLLIHTPDGFYSPRSCRASANNDRERGTVIGFFDFQGGREGKSASSLSVWHDIDAHRLSCGNSSLYRLSDRVERGGRKERATVDCHRPHLSQRPASPRLTNRDSRAKGPALVPPAPPCNFASAATSPSSGARSLQTCRGGATTGNPSTHKTDGSSTIWTFTHTHHMELVAVT